MNAMTRERGRALLATVALAAFGLVSGTARAQAQQVGEVSFLTGEADRAPNGSDQWQTLKQGSKLHQGDRVRTKAAARLEAKLNDGSLLRLGEKSELKLELATFNKKNPGQKKVKARLM